MLTFPSKDGTIILAKYVAEGNDEEAVSGALSVFGGYLGGIAGVHNTVFTKLLSQKGDLLLRLFVENLFTSGFKLTNALIKSRFYDFGE